MLGNFVCEMKWQFNFFTIILQTIACLSKPNGLWFCLLISILAILLGRHLLFTTKDFSFGRTREVTAQKNMYLCQGGSNVLLTKCRFLGSVHTKPLSDQCCNDSWFLHILFCIANAIPKGSVYINAFAASMLQVTLAILFSLKTMQ